LDDQLVENLRATAAARQRNGFEGAAHEHTHAEGRRAAYSLDILGALPKRRSGSLGLHDRFPGLALAHRTLATLAFGGALFGRCHPAASAFLHSEVSFDLREYSIGARATVQMKTLKTMVTGKH
jgi:hypothetical protein